MHNLSRVWIMTVGEPLPSSMDNRLLRSGIFSKYLAKSNVDVTFITSSFNHSKKEFFLANENRLIRDIVPGISIQFLKGLGYSNNISIRRLIDHYFLERSFQSVSVGLDKPDIIICSYPLIGLCDRAISYGEKNGIPVIIDIRDLWPDDFLELGNKNFRGILKFILYPIYRRSKKVLKNASGIIGLTDSFLEWSYELSGRKKTLYDAVFPIGYKQDSESNKLGSVQNVKSGTIELHVIFLGTVGHQFDFDSIISAASILEKENYNVQWTLAGSGDKFNYYKAISLKLKNVNFVGFLKKRELSDLAACADIGIAPYIQSANFMKNIPNKPYEYMSFGLPILSAVDGEIGSLLRKYRIGRVYHSVESLVSSIKLYITEEETLRIEKKNSVSVFNKKFSSDIIYSKFLKHLQVVLDYHND